MPEESTPVVEAVEEWRAVPGADGWYEVSDQGRVRSWFAFGARPPRRANEPRPMRLAVNRYGYQVVRLAALGRRRPVHRMVLAAFVGPCPPGMEACHNNGVRNDNRLSNLRWDTRTANHADKRHHGTTTAGERNPHAKLNDASADAIRRARMSGRTERDVAGAFGVSRSAVYLIMCGKSWRSGDPELLAAAMAWDPRRPRRAAIARAAAKRGRDSRGRLTATEALAAATAWLEAPERGEGGTPWVRR